MVESLLFLGAGAGVGVSEKNTWSRSRSKTDWLRNTDYTITEVLISKILWWKGTALLKSLPPPTQFSIFTGC